MNAKTLTLLACTTLIALCANAAEPAAFLKEHFPGKLTDRNGKEVPRSALAGKAIGIYFSADWCKPCKQFVPALINFHNANKDKFEVVLVSMNREKERHVNYMKETKMPWLAVEHMENPMEQPLVQKYNKEGRMPLLIILKPSGEVFTTKGRQFVVDGESIAKVFKVEG